MTNPDTPYSISKWDGYHSSSVPVYIWPDGSININPYVEPIEDYMDNEEDYYNA